MPRPSSYRTPPTGHLGVLLKQGSGRVERLCVSAGLRPCLCPCDWSRVLTGLPDHVNKEGQVFAGVRKKISLSNTRRSREEGNAGVLF